jgi:transcriptional regulator with XRE-family HTH domain
MASAPKKQPRQVQVAAAAFGARLKAARNAEGLTLREVSERSGLSITYLSDLERGELQNPTLKALEAIGSALTTPLDELLGVATRVLVVFHGSVRAVSLDRDEIGRAMLGATASGA